MKVLSLFDGISCGRLALERVGIPVEKYYASEIDKYAIQVAQKNYPDTIQVGDVTKLNYLELLDIDMVIGGSPCQDLSIAKQNREGLRGARSGLFWKYVEALEVIHPKWFLLENVASMRNEDRDAITATLKKIYPETECIMINSALLSAQQRKRYYWTNWHVEQPQNKGILLKDILESGYSCDVENQGKKLCKTVDKAQTLMARDYKGFGNQRMTGVAVPCVMRTREDELGKFKRVETKDDGKANSLTSVQTDSMVAEPVNINGTEYEFYQSERKSKTELDYLGGVITGRKQWLEDDTYKSRSFSQGNRVYSVRGKSVSLNANGGGLGAKTGLYKVDLPDGDYIIRKLTPVECERLQTLPDGWTAKGAIQWNYASVMGVTENVKLTLDSALCTINDGKGVEQQSCQNTKENNVNFVAELQLQEKCATGIIRIGNGTKTQNIQIKLDGGITDTAIRNPKENIKSNIENLPQNLLEEICCQQKWFIILTLIKKTIQEKTYSFAQTHNINKYTLNCKLSQGNSLEMDLSSLKMESIVEISNTQRYKAIGNGWTCDVIAWIFSQMPKD